MKWNLPQPEIDGWLSACRDAVESEEAFRDFRRMDFVTYMAESHHASHVADRWAKAVELWPAIESFLPALSHADKLGNPMESDVGMVDVFPLSGTTANSAFRVAQIKHLFGDRTFNVAEIGGGYGNFAAVMSITNSLSAYTGFDLKEPSMLQARYLFRQGYTDGVWPALGGSESDHYNLCFAHASLNELDSAAFRHYVERVLSRSERGFIYWPDDPRWGSQTDWLRKMSESTFGDDLYLWGLETV